MKPPYLGSSVGIGGDVCSSFMTMSFTGEGDAISFSGFNVRDRVDD